MNQRTLNQGGSILRMAPFRPGSDEAMEVPLRFVDVGGRPHILYSAADPPAWVSWATTDLVTWRIGEKGVVASARPGDGRASLDRASTSDHHPEGPAQQPLGNCERVWTWIVRRGVLSLRRAQLRALLKWATRSVA